MAEFRPKTLVIVRHGETEWNEVAKAVRLKQIPLPDHLKDKSNHMTVLSELGEKQSRMTGKKLAELYGCFDAVYHSPYTRAVRTADRGAITDGSVREGCERNQSRVRCEREDAGDEARRRVGSGRTSLSQPEG